MKHITAQKLVVPGFNKGLIKIVSQTNLGVAFGNSEDGKRFTASNGITLASNRRPARDEADVNVIWLRGTDATKNDVSIALPVKKLDKVVKAIEEYNFYYTVAEINKRVRARRERVAAEEAAEAARRQRAAAPCVEIVG